MNFILFYTVCNLGLNMLMIHLKVASVGLDFGGGVCKGQDLGSLLAPGFTEHF